MRRCECGAALLPLVLLCDRCVTPALDAQAPAQGRVIAGATQHILPERERPAVINRMLQDRLTTLLPRLMRETGFDMWLVINREYVEDPVYLTLVPAPVFHARRMSMLVFFDRGGGKASRRLTVSRYPMGGYTAAWQGGTDESQWKRLAEIVAERKPKQIGINTSRKWSFGDGLTGGLRDRLMEALGPDAGGADGQRRGAVRALAGDAHAARARISTRTSSRSRAGWSPRRSRSASSRPASRRPTTWRGTSASGSPTSACRSGSCRTSISSAPGRVHSRLAVLRRGAA